MEGLARGESTAGASFGATPASGLATSGASGEGKDLKGTAATGMPGTDAVN